MKHAKFSVGSRFVDEHEHALASWPACIVDRKGRIGQANRDCRALLLDHGCVKNDISHKLVLRNDLLASLWMPVADIRKDKQSMWLSSQVWGCHGLATWSFDRPVYIGLSFWPEDPCIDGTVDPLWHSILSFTNKNSVPDYLSS